MLGDSLTGIDIVIPNWNGRDMLETCLASLQAQSCREFNIIIVDNGSTDDSVIFVRDRYPDVQLVELQQNIGFSAAVNRGIAAGRQAWVLLLNNDIEVESRCIENLIKAIGLEPRTRMFALKMLSFHDRSMVDGAGDGVLRGGVGYRLGTMEHDSPRYQLKRPVFGACAGAALYHRKLFERVGMFDEDFFAYLEDVDFNLRAVRAGYRCMFLPDSVVYHIGSATSGSKINAMTVRLTTRNNMFVISKNYTFLMLLRFLPAICIYQFFWLIFVIKKGQLTAYLNGLFQSVSKLRQMRNKRLGSSECQLAVSTFSQRIIESEKEVLGSIMSRRSEEGKSNALLRFYRTIFC
jgi:GT2 family glycosyltransferase